MSAPTLHSSFGRVGCGVDIPSREDVEERRLSAGAVSTTLDTTSAFNTSNRGRAERAGRGKIGSRADAVARRARATRGGAAKGGTHRRTSFRWTVLLPPQSEGIVYRPFVGRRFRWGSRVRSAFGARGVRKGAAGVTGGLGAAGSCLELAMAAWFVEQGVGSGFGFGFGRSRCCGIDCSVCSSMGSRDLSSNRRRRGCQV